MAVRNTLIYLLMKSLQRSKKSVKLILDDGQVTVNGVQVFSNIFFEKSDEVRFNGQLLFEPFKIVTILYHKPPGVECTMNQSIPDNLRSKFPEWDEFFPVGRLDKASEGLLLLTNSGKLYRELNHFDSDVEKEYIVRVNKPINSAFVSQMAAGVKILGKMTLPCTVVEMDQDSFKIVLKQGLNRQIRRMCYKLGYEVCSLRRTRIGHYSLGDLLPGEWKILGN